MLFCFLSYQENICMIHHHSDLLYGIYNTINGTIKYKLTTFHWFFQTILISFLEWSKKFLYKFICFIIKHDFYIITFWMHYTLFIIMFGRNKVNCYCLLNFKCIRFFETIMISFKYGLILLRYFLTDSFFSITVIFVFNITISPKIINSYWFIKLFFCFMFKEISNISNYYVFNFFIFF